MTDLFILAGEHSGDLHGSHLVAALKQQNPSLKIRGIAGPKMRDQGVETLLPMEEFEVMGFAQIVARLPRIWKQFHYIRDHILATKPKGVILVDYPGFNIRLAQALRKKGYQGRIVQFICPTVWAWGKNRIPKMVESLDLLLTIFPFEPAIFSNTSLKAQFVGHPLIESLNKYKYQEDWHEKTGIDLKQHLLAIFPGSRRMEVAHNLEKQIYAAKKLKEEKPDLKVAISCARPEYQELIEEQLKTKGFTIGYDAFVVPSEYSYELMRACQTAIAKSGTVTLELALHRKPAVVVYEVYLLNAIIARYVMGINLKHYSIVNILGEKEIYPELITYRYSADKLFDLLKEMDSDTPLRKAAIAGCDEVRNKMRESRSSQEAAQAILKLIQ